LNEVILVVILLIALCLIIDGILVLLIKVIPMKKPTTLKYERYESGNLPVTPPKYTLPMQYLGYLFMFMACEPILVLLLVLMVNPSTITVLLISIIFLVLVPSLYVSYKYTLELAYAKIKHKYRNNL